MSHYLKIIVTIHFIQIYGGDVNKKLQKVEKLSLDETEQEHYNFIIKIMLINFFQILLFKNKNITKKIERYRSRGE